MKKPFQILPRLAALKVALFMAPLAANAAVITVNPTLDGNLRSPSSGTFTGQSFIIGDTGSITAPASEARYLNGLISFSLPDLAGSTIHSVSLVFTSTGDSGTNSQTPVTYELYLSTRAFTNAATWTQFDSGRNWAVAGGSGEEDLGSLLSSITLNTGDYAGTGNMGKKLTLPTSAAFADEVARHQGSELYLWFGLSPGDMEDNNRHILSLASMRNATIGYRPVLLIDYTPVPEGSTTAFLALSTVLGLCLMKFHRCYGAQERAE